MAIITLMVLRSVAHTSATSPSRPFRWFLSRSCRFAIVALLFVQTSAAAGRAGKTQVAKPKTDPSSAAATAAHAGTIGPGNTIFFIEGGLRNDLGTFKTSEVVGRLENEEVTDVHALGPMFHFGFLTKIFGDFRAGAAIGYGMNATMKERPTAEEKDNPDFQPEEFRFGQLITGDLRVEYSKHLGDRFWLTLTPRGGLSIIQVGEDLRDETEALVDSHFVRKPRLGFVIGGDIGTRYQINEWFGARASFGLAYAAQSYLKATRNGDAADSDRSWSSSTSRMSWGLAAEASF